MQDVREGHFGTVEDAHFADRSLYSLSLVVGCWVCWIWFALVGGLS
jgi:hypothetical protein